ncbi:restriction endonuclease subunit S [uncultured Flavonifractor sp.]|uniref:restriction endonuclease subunit S n=1 Tax=uncultured Flavonifractor sp. TaxID=1193534 RepID=UPI0025D1F83C|nr:restriction endonuclease subunit S [uncultured Flavonifractor sp.]
MEKFLPEICTIQYGFPFDSAKFSTSEGMPLIRIRDVVRGYSETFTTEEYKEEYIVSKDDLLIGMDGEFNIAKWGETPALLNQRVCRLFPTSEVDKNYLFYFMPSALKRIEEKTPFVTVKHLSAKELNKVKVPLPPLDEQRRIAAVLDKISGLIAKRREQLDKLDELVKARFVEMFGDPVLNPMDWPTYQLADMADIVSGITKGRKTKEQDLIEVPYMAVSNVKDGYIDWTTIKTIWATQSEIDQYRLLPDDVLMTEGGDPDKLGRGAIIQNPLENCIHQNHIFRVRLNENIILPVYFAEFLQHQKAKQYFLRCAKQTTGIASINMTQLKELPTLVPPRALQKDFTNTVEQINKSKLTIQQSLDKLEVLKKALMQQYFG